MSSGGSRENAGRKRIGVVVNTRIEEQLIEQIELYIQGLNRADKIRKCLQLGVESRLNYLATSQSESNAAAVSSFFKTYLKLFDLLQTTEAQRIETLNLYLLGYFTSIIPSFKDTNVEESVHEAIISELNKYSWSLNEADSSSVITPNVVGSVVEKIVNRKETGSYYTPRDTTNYIAKYSIVFSLLCKCDSTSLANLFYEQYSSPTNQCVLNDDKDPVISLSNAINKLSLEERMIVFRVLLDFTIIDPTCGTGAFIIAAADILVRIYKATNMYLFMSLNDFAINLFQKNLYGIDILDCAISLINLRCKLYLYNLGISQEIVDSIEFHFYKGDSLTKINSLTYNSGLWDLRDIFDAGGFDCVIGNPPYIEASKSGVDISEYGEYKTQKCGNLYAYIFENALSMLQNNSYMGMIVPISIVSTQRMEPLRTLLFESCENIYLANFSDRPSCLFTGVHQKLSIVFTKKTRPFNGCKVYSTTYLHWSKSERSSLFESIKYCRTTKELIDSTGVPKIGDGTKLSIIRQIAACPHPVVDMFTPTDTQNNVYMNQRMTFWAKCFTAPEPSNEYKTFHIKEGLDNKAVAALFNSSLFYMLWETYSDCWHITSADINTLRVPGSFFDQDLQTELSAAEIALENKLKETREYIYSKQTDYIFVHRKCINEIHHLNDIVAKVYGFSTEEIEYIQSYNERYRLSNSSSEGEE